MIELSIRPARELSVQKAQDSGGGYQLSSTTKAMIMGFSLDYPLLLAKREIPMGATASRLVSIACGDLYLSCILRDTLQTIEHRLINQNGRNNLQAGRD
jgi:hypothetical protein